MNDNKRALTSEGAGCAEADAVVVASGTSGRAKKPLSLRMTASGRKIRFTVKAIAVALILSFGESAYALPAGGTVSAGSATINSAGGKMIVTESTPSVTINWQSFNIGKGEAVQFIQPSSSSAALNRVLGGGASTINGSLSANGQLFLVNPSGITFGRGAQVNVGGLVASTLAISDSQFMSGSYKFSNVGTGAILNQGSITADGGHVALLGANVSNEGIISARMGTVALVAGSAITLDVAGDGLLNVTVDQGAAKALVQNGGLIQAGGGQVLLTAQAAGTLLQGAVNNTGVILAQSIENHNGTIRLLADTQTGTATVAGRLDVSGRGAGQTGGTINITGHAVKLAGATINASGRSGGGRVAVGGNLHGAGSLANAQSTSLDSGVTITADAITAGNGGEIAVWSDGATAVDGTLRALGGAVSGDGGYIETSGHTLKVADSIVVNTSAAYGAAGTWLLDPTDFTIGVAGSNMLATTLSGLLVVNDIIITSNGGTYSGTTYLGTAGGNGDIFVNSAITWTSAKTLTLNADRNVIINAAVTSTGGSFFTTAGALGNVTINNPIVLTGGSFGATAGLDLTMNSGAAVTVTGGNFAATVGRNANLNSGSNITTTGTGVKASNVTITAGGSVNESAVITTTDGSIAATAKVNIDINLAAGELITTTRGNIALKSDSDGTGQTAGVGGGTVTFTSCTACIVTTASTATDGITSIYYNPVTYAALTDYGTLSYVTGTGVVVNSYAWVFAKGSNKTYDGTDAATVAFATTPAGTPTDGGHAVTLDGSGATFNNKNVGTGKNVAMTGYVLGGTDAVKFALFSGTGTTTANVTPRSLSIKASDAAKIYGESIDLNAYTTVGLVADDSIDDVNLSSPGTASGASAAGSPYKITPKNASGGSFLAANYAITYLQGKLVVTAAAPGKGGGTPSSGGSSGTTSPSTTSPSTTSPSTTSPSTTSPSVTSPDSTLRGGSSDTTSPDSTSRGGSSDSSTPITPGADTGEAAGATAAGAGAGQAVMAGGVPGAMTADDQAATMMVVTPTETVLIAGPAPGHTSPLLPGKQDRN